MKQTVVFVLVGLLAFGCQSSPEAKLLGTYTGTVELTPETLNRLKSAAAMAGENANDAETRIRSEKYGMQLQSGGKAQLWFESSGKKTTYDGTWQLSVDGRSIAIAFDPKSNPEGGRPANMLMTLSGDGTRIMYEMSQYGVPLAITFARE